jgi:hypothetical protein
MMRRRQRRRGLRIEQLEVPLCFDVADMDARTIGVELRPITATISRGFISKFKPCNTSLWP